MSRSNIDYGTHGPTTDSSGGLQLSLKPDVHDERGSQSGSEDGYSLYPDAAKAEVDPDR